MNKAEINRTESEGKFWDAKAASYDKVINEFFPEAYRLILDNVTRDTTHSEHLLEIATGTGIIALTLSAQVPRITAIDIAPNMLSVARAKSAEKQINNIDFRIGDACKLQFSDKTFDTVIASNVLHLLFQPNLALQEIKRVLKDDGKIIIPTFCHGANIGSHVLSRILELLGQKTKNRWSPKDFKEFMEHNGFRIVKERYMPDKIPLLYLVCIKNEAVDNF